MKYVIFICVSAILLVAFSCTQKHERASSFFHPVQKMDDTLQNKLKTIDEKLQMWVSSGDFIGGEVLIIRDKDILMQQTYGMADVEDSTPIRKNMLYRIRSMTKPFVGTAVLMLAGQGKIMLEEPVATYLPAFDNDKSQAITVKQLITHTAGFTQPGFPRGGIYDYNSLEEAVADLGKHGPALQPGTQYMYSDAGTSTMARLVAKVSGMPSGAFIQKYISELLNLQSTYTTLPVNDSIRHLTVSTYEWQGDAFGKYWDNEAEPDISFFRGSGGIYCNPMDYARFLYAWSNPQAGFLTKETKHAALQPTELTSNYGYQMELYHVENGQPLAFGHGGSDGTVAMSIPSQDLLLLFFTQTRGTLVIARFEELVLDLFNLKAAPEYEFKDINEKALNQFKGRFEGPIGYCTFFQKNERFYAQFMENMPLHLRALSDTAFINPDVNISFKFQINNQNPDSLFVQNRDQVFKFSRKQ